MRDDRLHCCCLPPSLGDACAQGGSKVDRIEIVEAGLYRAETAAIEHGARHGDRQRHILSEHQARRIDDADRGEARRAFRHAAIGSSASPSHATVKLISVTQYPAPGLKNPKSDSNQMRGEHSLFATIGQINYRGYVFEHDWELVPGTWTLELWDGNRKLASQTFDVVKP